MQDDPLAQMRDIHLPGEPGFWPPAPGWWLVLLLLLLLLALCVRWLVAKRQRSAPRRQALRELEADHAACNRGELAPNDAIHRANALLKRLWVHVDGDQSIASLSGDRWLAYLDQRSGTTAYTDGAGRALGAMRFSAVAPAFDAQLVALIKKLLESKRPVAP